MINKKVMNRLVLIGNGFDLAHGLPTKYEHFIDWYWKEVGRRLLSESSDVVADSMCSFKLKDGIAIPSWQYMWGTYYQRSNLLEQWDAKQVVTLAKSDSKICYFRIESSLFDRICKQIEYGWVDIENIYYELLKEYVIREGIVSKTERLNNDLLFIQEKLVEYLKSLDTPTSLLKTDIRQKIYAPIKVSDISIESENALINHVNIEMKQDKNYWDDKLRKYDSNCYMHGYVGDYKEKFGGNVVLNDEIPDELLLPNHIMLLNFNYTHTADLYCKKGNIFSVNQIHGDLNKPESVIFGYGDELDENYKTIVNQNENKYLGNIKSIKYLEADNYRKILSFIESEPYQILIMGHSCGNSDRTLLNTLFEHKNCVSIKPYYHQIDAEHDNYIELIQNISRNFKDMKLMRDRVVNKTYCEPLTRNN